MDDPVAIALLVAGSSAALALALITRHLIGGGGDFDADPKSEAADRAAARDADRRDAARKKAESDASRKKNEPAPASSAPASPERRRVATPAEADVFAGTSEKFSGREPEGDVFGSRIAADAPTEKVAQIANPAPEGDVFGSRIAADAPTEKVAQTESAAPQGDVFGSRIAADAPTEKVAQTANPAPEGDVFGSRIAADAPTEKVAQTANPAPEGDVFGSRIAAGAPTEKVAQTESAAEVVSAAGAANGDPFARFIGDEAPQKSPEGGDPLYPEVTCREFAQGLKDEVLDRALTLFWALSREASIDSNDLSALLGARSRQAGALVSTPMRRRADAMGLPLPYVIGRSNTSRLRTWSDQFGIAERMAAALLAEQQARDNASDDGADSLAGLTAWLEQQPDPAVTVALEEIDALGPSGLPGHAWNNRNWWANRSGGPGHGQAEAWLSAGRLAFPDLKSKQIVFEALAGLGEAEQSSSPAESSAGATRA